MSKTAFITGAAQGIGRATAELLTTQGVGVVVADRNEEALAEVMGGKASPIDSVVVDVTDADAVSHSLDGVVARHGSVDILVNSAGVAGRSAPMWELGIDEWQGVVDANLSGTFYTMRAALPHMRERGWGRIVNVASIAGKEGNPNATPYSASKAGVIGLTKAAAKEVADTGILVNCVTPAVIETPLLSQVSEEHLTYMVSKIPMGRMGSAAEVAELIAWLSSPACSFSTGAVFDISGGRATY